MGQLYDQFYGLARRLGANTPIGRRLMPSYPYMFTPAQLSFLVGCLSETRDVPGCVLEVGCATGYTTLFLAAHMKAEGIRKEYLCIDTFGGFTPDDVAFERTRRGKAVDDYTGFGINDVGVFQATMRHRGADVRAIQADIGRHEFPPDTRVAFCLLDVDLFAPTNVGLAKIWPLLSSGGILVVDDVRDKNLFDGAYEAYHAFCRDLGITPEERHGKLGVLRKP